MDVVAEEALIPVTVIPIELHLEMAGCG